MAITLVAAIAIKAFKSFLTLCMYLLFTAGCRSIFTGSKPDTANPNWLRVGLAFGTTAFIWGLVN